MVFFLVIGNTCEDTNGVSWETEISNPQISDAPHMANSFFKLGILFLVQRTARLPLPRGCEKFRQRYGFRSGSGPDGGCEIFREGYGLRPARRLQRLRYSERDMA
ncbi:unnamed protein product [Ilex paraguariensis]|uniref:Uncharacterized protein n=1 Tax=Ilex paraguariensis TaxID=185542 RepID=A0ABC8TY60_9AQUA